MVTVPVVFALLLQQGSLADIHLPAMSLDKAVQRISEIYHSPMTLSNRLKDKIVLIEATHVSEAEVRDQIAKVFDADWEMKDSGWHLGQSPKQIAMEKERRTSLRAGMLRKTIEVRAKNPGTTAPFNAAFAAKAFHQVRGGQGSFFGITQGEYATPDQRLMSRFLAKFDPKRITSVENGQRVVFAVRPNAMQQPIGISLDADIAQMRAEDQIWKKVSNDLTKDQESKTRQDWKVNKGGDEEFEAPTYGMPSSISNVLFTVYGSDSGGTELTLVFLSTDPKEPYYSISASTVEAFLASLTEEDLSRKPTPDFKLSSESTDFAGFINHQETPISKERLNLFADPVTRDPLAYGLSESLVYDAKKVKKNIIAAVGDESIRISEPAFADTYFEDRFKDLLGDVIIKEGTWLRFNSLPFEGQIFPRQDLKRIIARLRINKRMDLEDRAEIAALKPRSQGAYSGIDTLIEAFAGQNFNDGGDPDCLRVLGLLQQSERLRALGPTGIPYGLLNPKLQQQLYESAYYNRRCTLSLSEGSRVDENSAIASEATLLAPNGISNSSIFRIEEERQDMIMGVVGDNPEGGLMSARALGEMKFRLDHPKDFPEERSDKNQPLYRATMSTYTFRLLINADCEWSSRLTKVTGKNPTPFTIANLPTDFREEFEAGYKDAAEELKQMNEQKKKDGDGGFKSLMFLI